MKQKPIFLVIPFIIATILACSLLNPPIPATEESVDVATDEPSTSVSFTVVTIHPSQGDLSPILAFHAGQAAQLDQTPYAEFTAEWCPPCKALANSLNDDRMIDAFRGTYIIRVDIDEWKSQLHKAGFNVIGVPTFSELDENGNPSGRVITGAAWGEDIPENMAPPLKEFFQGSSQE